MLTTDALKDEYRYRYLPENSEIVSGTYLATLGIYGTLTWSILASCGWSLHHLPRKILLRAFYAVSYTKKQLEFPTFYVGCL